MFNTIYCMVQVNEKSEDKATLFWKREGGGSWVGGSVNRIPQDGGPAGGLKKTQKIKRKKHKK